MLSSVSSDAEDLEMFTLLETKTRTIFYALKQIPIQNYSHAEAIRKEFLAMLVSLRHRHIIHLFSCSISKTGKSQLVANFIMEYCTGGTLNKRLSKPSSHAVDLKWMIQIADAVSFLHHKDIVHRDLKPENILLSTRENAKLCDLGLASSSLKTLSPDKTSSRKSRESCDYDQVGTPYYWSPELLNGFEYRKESDVFALGHILFAIKERCFIDSKRHQRLYGAFVKTDQGVISFGRALHCSPFSHLVFSDNKSAVDKAMRTVASAALAFRTESRPTSEYIFQFLKETARSLIESRKQRKQTLLNNVNEESLPLEKVKAIRV
ncbi:serine/threonine-protein kinase PDIK1L-like [Actinia tenebrosa]|uniref:Serine/threonine-protein kinase PDIK1L-like n=1 Tax=Actinia tenebrosa TaxID=6105 RepID=A0A6P8HNB4_ACTTE|nr:serine/threonine-protein kinase PDIK1L-like [Actinia tenebrosa]